MTMSDSTRRQLIDRANEEGLSVDAYLQHLMQLDDLTENTRLRLDAQEAIPAGISLADARQPDIPLIYVSRGFEDITGYSSEEIIGLNCRFLQGNDRDQTATQIIRQAIENGEIGRAVLRNYRKDGTPFWNELTLAPLRDEAGEVTHFVGVQMDVTEKVELRQQLQQRQAHLETLFQKNPLPMWVYNPADLRIVDVNEAAVLQYGYSRDEFLNMTIAEIRPEEDIDRLKQHLAKSRPDRQRSGIWTHRKKDGSLINVDIMSHTIDFEGDDAVLVVAVDVTDRIKAEQQLARSEKRYRVVSELSFDYAFALRILDDGSTETDWVTDAFQQITGYTPEESDARGGWQKLIHPDDYDRAMQVLKEAILTGEGGSLNYRIITKDESVRHIHGEHIPERDPQTGRVIRVYGVAHDITEQQIALQKLRQSEERFRTLVESFNDIVYTLDLEHRHTGVFGNWIEDSALIPDHFLGKTAYDLLPESAAKAHINANERAYRGESVSYEWSIPARDDSGRQYYQTSISPLRDDNGEIVGLVGVGRNITARVRATEELEFKTRLWSTITRLQRDFIAQTDTVSLFTDILNKLLELTDSEYGFIGELEYDPDGMPYLQTYALTDISWDAATKAYYDNHMPDGFQFRNLDTLFGYTIKTRQPIITDAPQNHTGSGGLPPGHPPLKNYMGLPIIRGERMVAMAGVANRPGGYTQDMIEMLRPYLTAVASLIEAHHSELERKAIQANLRHSENRFRRILEAASEAILLVNMDGDILLANQQASNIFGYDRQTLTSQSALELLPISQDDLAVNGKAYRQPGFVRQIGNRLDLHAHRQDGTRFPLRINLSYIEDNGEFQALCLIEDVTFRKQLEEQRLYTKTLQIELEKERELMELKQRFISMISHEFRTPLTVMLSSSQILERYHDRLSQERFLKHVTSFKPQIEKMTNMLEEVLLVNKADANLLEFKPKPTDIRQVLQQLTDKARLIDDYQHEITLYCEESIPQTLQADPALLEHMLMNLLTNATKYSPADRPVILDVQQDTASDDLVIHVKDEGIGIPADDQKRLFQPFHRAKNVQNIKGTGLGLTIVKNSVELHGGSVTFVSYPGEGSIFTIHLPLVVADDTNDEDGDITQASHPISTE